MPSPLPAVTIRRAGAGDRQARSELLQRYGSVVWSVCRSLCAEEAEDAYQEVWEKVFRGLGGFSTDGPATLATWIHTVAYRHMVDRHRKRRPVGTDAALQSLPAPMRAVDDQLDRAQRVSRLQSVLGRLSDAHRRAVVAHYLEELPIREVAAIEEVPMGTIKTRLHHARARLYAMLEGES